MDPDVIASWAVVLTALVYLCFLFAIAHGGDLAGRRIMRRRGRGTIYALALAAYCTSWTFYGSVGLASRSGLDFLTIYLGPILVVSLGYPLVARSSASRNRRTSPRWPTSWQPGTARARASRRSSA